MKTKSFTLNNKELLLVELPDIEDCDPVLVNESELFINGEYWELPFRVNTIGKLPEVTEHQYADLVKGIPHHTTGNMIYEDHTYYTDKPLTKNRVFQTAKESFFSKLESENIDFILDNTYLFEKV